MIIANIEVTPKATIDYLDLELHTLDGYSWQSFYNNMNKTIKGSRSKALADVTFFIYAFNHNGMYEKQSACNRFVIRLHNANSKAVIDKILAPLNQQFCILSCKLIELELAMDFHKADGTAWTPEQGAAATIHLLEYFKHPQDVSNKRMTCNGNPDPIDLSRKGLTSKIIKGSVNFAFNRKHVGTSGAYDLRANNTYYHIYFKRVDQHKDGGFKALESDQQRPRLEMNKLYRNDLSEIQNAIADTGRGFKMMKLKEVNPNKFAEQIQKDYVLHRGQDKDPHWRNGNLQQSGFNMQLDTCANTEMSKAIKQCLARF